jgi:RHS repeat-associated protein
VTQRLSYDAWGKRRNPDATSGSLSNPDMCHGYTGHEMLDAVGLIHMNGRLYDPVVARFVSADFMIQNPDNLQSYNRYTYGWNNPLSGTDTSG